EQQRGHRGQDDTERTTGRVATDGPNHSAYFLIHPTPPRKTMLRGAHPVSADCVAVSAVPVAVSAGCVAVSAPHALTAVGVRVNERMSVVHQSNNGSSRSTGAPMRPPAGPSVGRGTERSEERRVGKEGRGRWARARAE